MPSGVYERTDEHRQKIGESHKGKKHTEETKRKIAEWQSTLTPDELKEYKDNQSKAQFKRYSEMSFAERVKFRMLMRQVNQRYWRNLSPEERLRQSKIRSLTMIQNQMNMRAERGRSVVKKLCIKYGIPDIERFFPASLSDHAFARDVLINKKSRRSYIQHNGLREHSQYALRFKGDKAKGVKSSFSNRTAKGDEW